MIACSIWSPTARSSVAAAAGVLDAVTATWLKNSAELASSGIASAAVISLASR
jgi:hypothetical protein